MESEWRVRPRRHSARGGIAAYDCEMDVTIMSVVRENSALMAAGDTAGLVKRYAPDAEIVHAGGVARGRAQIRSLFTEQSRRSPEIVAAEEVGRTEDTVAYRARMRLDETVVDVVGTIVLRAGLIWRQTTVVVNETSG